MFNRILKSQFIEIALFIALLTSLTGGYVWFKNRPVILADANSMECRLQTPKLSTAAPNLQSNIILNSSVEVAGDSADKPQNWNHNTFGNNDATFTLVSNDGHTGSHSLRVDISAYVDGDAKWNSPDATVSANQGYIYADWFKSNVPTSVVEQIELLDGTFKYVILGTSDASANWQASYYTIVTPLNSKTISVVHTLSRVGWLQVDDISLQQYASQSLTEGMVSLTFDDGLTDTYEHALLLLKKYGIPSTQYIITDPIAHPSGSYYMSADQIKEFEKAGSEIGSHTVDHKDLATLSAAQARQELVDSQAYLTKLLGHPVSDFASPYGSFTQTTIEQLATTYCSHRSTYAGFNAPDMINPLRLKVQDIDKETSPEQVMAWIDFAKTQKVWIILVFHEVNPDGRHYSYPPASLEQVLQHLKSTQTKSVTVSKGLQAIKSAQVK